MQKQMGEYKFGKDMPRFLKLRDDMGRENIYYNTVSRDCPEEIRRYAEKELNETEENRRKGLEKLKAYIKREKLPELEDDYLIATLRCCKYNIKKSEVKLKKFCNVRRLIIKNIKKVDDRKIDQLISDGFTECLPWSDKQGRPIYIIRPRLSLDVYDYEEMAAYWQATIFSVLTYPLPTISGVAIIIDCKVNSPTMVWQMVNKYTKYIGMEKTVPLRIGRIDVVNENVIAHYVFAFIRAFLPAKIINRVAFHGSDFSTLHKIYHPDTLPDELGGTLGPVDTTIFKEEKINTIRQLKLEKNV